MQRIRLDPRKPDFVLSFQAGSQFGGCFTHPTSTPKKRPLVIVITRNFGQLGNRLLLSAHLISAAREYGVTLVNPSFAEYARYFPTTADDLWCRYPSVSSSSDRSSNSPSSLRRNATYKAIYLTARLMWHLRMTRFPVNIIRLGKQDSFDLASTEFERLAKSRIPLLVSGWEIRSETLLEKHSDAVRDHFQILPKHRANVDELIRVIRQRADVLIGVHIRHGDYARFENGRYFYSIQQYVAAMRRIEDQLRGHSIAFLVCGNTQFDRRDFRGLDVHFGTGHLIEDMYSFAEADLLVGPPSTFTLWASFYGQTPLQFMETSEQAFDLSTISDSPSVRRTA